MTWIRLDCGSPDHPVIGHLATDLKIDRDRAFALYVRTLLGFGDYQPDGYPAFVDNGTIEEWARWKGKAGKFADAFRRLCVETEEGEKDPIGRIRGWWRQDALLKKQEKDRQKPAGNARIQPESPENPPEIPRGNLGCNDDDDGYVDGSNPSTHQPARAASESGRADGDVSPIAYAQQCTGACNRGLRKNPAYANGNGFNELVTSAQVEFTSAWYKAGIPVNFAAGVILERAEKYKPTTRYRQPFDLRYFDKGVREAWERSGAAASADGVTPIASAPEEDDIMAAARRAQRKREMAGGAS